MESEKLRNSEIKGDLGRRFFGLVSKKQNRGESERDRNRRTERFFFFLGEEEERIVFWVFEED